MLKLTRSHTNQTIVDMHHDLFDVSPPITLDEFHHYLYWHNRGWGNQTQTVEMVVSTAPLTTCLLSATTPCFFLLLAPQLECSYSCRQSGRAFQPVNAR